MVGLNTHHQAFGGWVQETKSIMMLNVPRRRQSAMVDHQVVNKENVPPQVRSNMTTQRPTRTNRVFATNPRGKWSNESL
jgi:hypothetical protein